MRGLVLIVGVCVALGTAAAGFFLISPRASGPRLPGGDHWGGGLPVLVDVDGDGIEDPIGRFAYGGHASARSGKDWKPLWQEGVDGTLLGERLVAFEKESVVYGDPRTGKELARYPLSDRPIQHCRVGDRIRVRALDEVIVEIDGRTPPRVLDRTTRVCEDQPEAGPCRPGARCGFEDGPGHRAVRIEDGPAGARLRWKDPGTPHLSLLGPIEGGAPRYTLDLDHTGEARPVDQLLVVPGRLYVKQWGTITAVDLASGRILWRADRGNSSPSGMLLSKGRLYVEQDGIRNRKGLRVCDAETGAVLAQFGA